MSIEEEKAAYKVELAAWEGGKKADRGPRPEAPIFRHVVTTDATTEALAPMLLHSKGLLLFKDELTGWVRGMDQYRSGGKGADRQHYLSMWSRSLIKVDRKSSAEPIIVQRPLLSVFGGIQPDLLPDLADSAQREDGFVDRAALELPRFGRATTGQRTGSIRRRFARSSCCSTISRRWSPDQDDDEETVAPRNPPLG